MTDDLNKDGKLDLAASYKNPFPQVRAAQVVSVFRGKGDGSFQPRVDYPFDSTFDNAVVGISDMNGDGEKDLIAARGKNITAVFLGNGDGTFQSYLDSTGVLAPTAIQFGDLNGDGKNALKAGATCSE